MYKNKKIIVALTSWKKRITNVPKVIYMLERQTLIPDEIILTLAEDEFPNKEQELPSELVLFNKTLDNFHINWVKENTKAFKKVIPIIKLYKNENCWILSVDDDIHYNDTYIKFMVDTAEQNKNMYLTPGIDGLHPHGYAMIYNPIWFKDDKLWSLTKTDMDIIIASDDWIGNVLQVNNIKPKKIKEILKHLTFLNIGNKLSSEYAIKNKIIERRNYIKKLLEK